MGQSGFNSQTADSHLYALSISQRNPSEQVDMEKSLIEDLSTHGKSIRQSIMDTQMLGAKKAPEQIAESLNEESLPEGMHTMQQKRSEDGRSPMKHAECEESDEEDEDEEEGF